MWHINAHIQSGRMFFLARSLCALGVDVAFCGTPCYAKG